MTPNILHNHARNDRRVILEKELAEQGIEQYRLWDIIHAPTVIESINIGFKQMVQWAKDEGLPEVLLFEDDIKFLGAGAFDYYIKLKPKHFDLYLGSIFLGALNHDNTVDEFTGMTILMVHSRFYDTFLNTPTKMHIDHALANKGLYCVCNPFVAIQHSGYSDNTKSFQNYDHIFLERNLYKSNT